MIEGLSQPTGSRHCTNGQWVGPEPRPISSQTGVFLIVCEALMRNIGRMIMFGAAGVLGLSLASTLLAHGNVTPQAVDVSGLKPIGADWLGKNPYSGDTRQSLSGPPPTTRIAHAATASTPYRAGSHRICAISNSAKPAINGIWSAFVMARRATARFTCRRSATSWDNRPGWAIRAWLETKHEE